MISLKFTSINMTMYSPNSIGRLGVEYVYSHCLKGMCKKGSISLKSTHYPMKRFEPGLMQLLSGEPGAYLNGNIFIYFVACG